MSVLNLLSSLGEKITGLLGDSSENGSSSNLHAESRHLLEGDPLARILPYQAYDPQSGTFINSSSVGFVIEALPLVGSDQAGQNEILSVFQEIMEEGSSIQCLLWSDHRVGNMLDKWVAARDTVGGLYKQLAQRRAAHLSDPSKVSVKAYRFILSYSIPCEDPSPEDLRQLAEIQSRILKTLSGLTYAFAWDADDFVSSLDGLINFSFGTEAVKRRWNPLETLSNQIPSGGGILIDDEGMTWKNSDIARFKSYRTIDMPDTWSMSAMQGLIGDLYRDAYRLTVPFVIHYGIHCPNQEKAESQFHRRMHLVENQGKSPSLLRMIPDLGEELRELDFVRRSVNQSNRFVWTQLGIGIWDSEKHMNQSEQTLKSLFRMNGFTLATNDYVHFPQFLSFLPMTWSEYIDDFRNLNLLKTTLATEAGNLVPIQGEWYGTPTPGMLLLGRRGQLMNWNPFDNRSGNYNVVVTGRSGSGKSVFMQELLISTLGIGGRVFVLEVGRSFEKTCAAVDGQQIEFDSTTNLCINPFTTVSVDDEVQRDQSFGMLKSIVSTMASPGEGGTDYERSVIERAIRVAWEKKGQSATISTIADYLHEQEDSRAKSLAVMLTPYTKGGVYARYFEGRNNVDFTRPFVLIELEELKDKKDLQSVVLQMFIMIITNQTLLGDRKVPFHICIDEAWDLLRGGQTGVFIETLARRLRKYNGSLVIGTQSIDDFYSTPGALAAFENSDWMCLLSQKKSSIQRFAESGRVDMDPAKKAALESVTTRHGEFSETMICDAEGNYSIGRLMLDPFSDLLYSTQADEFSRIKELESQGLSVEEAIERVLAGV